MSFEETKKSICLVIPSLVPGGMERVIIELAMYFGNLRNIEVHLITITRKPVFYDLHNAIPFHEPDFDICNHFRFISLVRTWSYLRKLIKSLKPQYLLSFGGKYNSFVLSCVLGLNVKTYISDRSRPSISYGWFLDIINPIMYKKADGIIAQTSLAKDAILKNTGHSRIKVIGNPLNIVYEDNAVKENIILHVGRFIRSKGQLELLNIFESLNSTDWKLVFIGDGPDFETVKSAALNINKKLKIEFYGFVNDVNKYYSNSRIFAFNSSSEGFPNALAEAMAFGLACVSYDCEAGPSDLIDAGENGFLVKVGDIEDFRQKIELLMKDTLLREKFGKAAREKVRSFDISIIGEKYLKFLLNEADEDSY